MRTAGSFLKTASGNGQNSGSLKLYRGPFYSVVAPERLVGTAAVAPPLVLGALGPCQDKKRGKRLSIVCGNAASWRTDAGLLLLEGHLRLLLREEREGETRIRAQLVSPPGANPPFPLAWAVVA